MMKNNVFLKMRNILLSFILFFVSFFCYGQQMPSKMELKKKYESSNIIKESHKGLASTNVYPDSIVLSPIHYVNTSFSLTSSSPVIDLDSISVDIEIKTKVPNDYKLFIAPFSCYINTIPFYAGIQTAAGGRKKGSTSDLSIGRGGIFSRWMERDTNAIKTDGYYSSSDGEGDFISVRDSFIWDRGTYRITIKKGGHIDGKPLKGSFSLKELSFIWGEYEHTWAEMIVEDLGNGKKKKIGSLAFPGPKLLMSSNNILFLEYYGDPINYSLQRKVKGSVFFGDLPGLKIIMKNVIVNGKSILPLNVKHHINETFNPEQKKIAMPLPVMVEAKETVEPWEINYFIGKK